MKPKSFMNELLLDRLLRDLPLRRAPATLELRVFGQLERRAARVWWRRGFTAWPIVTRGAFVILCSAIVVCSIFGPWATAGIRTLRGVGALATSWVHPAASAVAWASEFSVLLVRVIPPAWLYGVVAAGALLYAMLFGLGAAAYRMLYLQPSMAGDFP